MTSNFEWEKRCRTEATRDVVFLLSRIELTPRGVPKGYEAVPNRDCFVNKDGAVLSYALAREKGLQDSFYGGPCVIAIKRPQHIFLDRAEAEAWLKDRAYNYPDGWEIYSLPAEGEIIEVIKQGLDAFTPVPTTEVQS